MTVVLKSAYDPTNVHNKFFAVYENLLDYEFYSEHINMFNTIMN